MQRPLKVVASGDYHHGHDTTPAEKLAEEIKHCFPHGKWAHSIDVFIIEGDWWDKLLPNNHPDVYTTEKNIYYMLYWAKQHDITLLLVDGTPLHDAGQIQKFVHINENAGIHADLYLVDDIDILYIPRHDIHVLFIPDRPRITPEETIRVVHERLQEKGLSQVDMAVMHGCFRYQLPAIADEHKHKEDDYESIVNGPIFIGHIHRHSSKGKIIAPGSFSRLTHGEEEPKGYVEAVVQPDGSFTARFIENEAATIYKSIDVSNMELEESLQQIRRVADRLPDGSNIRVILQQGHPMTADKSLMDLKMEYSLIRFTVKVVMDKTIVGEKHKAMETEVQYVPLIINANNLTELVLDRAAQRNVDASVLEAIPKYLNEVMP